MNMKSWIGRSSLLALVCLGSTPLPALATVDNAVLQIGRFSILNGCGVNPLTVSGYPNSLTGAYSPAGLTGGKTVVQLMELFNCPTGTVLAIGGFTSDPGGGYLNSVTCNGITLLGSHANRGYDSPSGRVSYSWLPPEPSFGLTFLSSSVSCSIDHN